MKRHIQNLSTGKYLTHFGDDFPPSGLWGEREEAISYNKSGAKDIRDFLNRVYKRLDPNTERYIIDAQIVK